MTNIILQSSPTVIDVNPVQHGTSDMQVAMHTTVHYQAISTHMRANEARLVAAALTQAADDYDKAAMTARMEEIQR